MVFFSLAGRTGVVDAYLTSNWVKIDSGSYGGLHEIARIVPRASSQINQHQTQWLQVADFQVAFLPWFSPTLLFSSQCPVNLTGTEMMLLIIWKRTCRPHVVWSYLLFRYTLLLRILSRLTRIHGRKSLVGSLRWSLLSRPYVAGRYCGARDASPCACWKHLTLNWWSTEALRTGVYSNLPARDLLPKDQNEPWAGYSGKSHIVQRGQHTFRYSVLA